MAGIEVRQYIVSWDTTYIGPHWRPNVYVFNKLSGETTHEPELVGLRMSTRQEAEQAAERCAMRVLKVLKARSKGKTHNPL